MSFEKLFAFTNLWMAEHAWYADDRQRTINVELRVRAGERLRPGAPVFYNRDLEQFEQAPRPKVSTYTASDGTTWEIGHRDRLFSCDAGAVVEQQTATSSARPGYVVCGSTLNELFDLVEDLVRGERAIVLAYGAVEVLR